jgi:hypothetical protein
MQQHKSEEKDKDHESKVPLNAGAKIFSKSNKFAMNFSQPWLEKSLSIFLANIDISSLL